MYFQNAIKTVFGQMWRVSGEESYPDHYGEFLESFLETIRVFLEIGEKIGYPQMSGESNCLAIAPVLN